MSSIRKSNICKNIEDDIRQEIADGIEDAEANGIIKFAINLGLSDNEIIENLCKILEYTPEEAASYLQDYKDNH